MGKKVLKALGWEVICYLVGGVVMLLSGTLVSFCNLGSWETLFTVLDYGALLLICVGLVVGIWKTRRFCFSNLLRVMVLFSVVVDTLMRLIK